MRSLLFVLFAGLAVVPAQAASVTAAVAANFAAVADELGAAFKAATGNDLLVSAGSTGALYAQIAQGAPFQVFLAADSRHARLAVSEGLAVEGSAFTYAVGRIVLYAGADGPLASRDTLAAGNFLHLAIADPATAPYGAAAQQTLAALGLTDTLAGKLVTGTSISQALGFVESGNAELGFVALSQVVDRTEGTQWLVPERLHDPITQDAVLLAAAADNQAAKDFLAFLRSDAARAIIARFGYASGD